MRTGLYFDLRNPSGWRRDWSRHYAQNLEIAEEADRLGVASLWASEHHLFDDGYLPQPLTFLAAVAARTRHARLGTAVLLAPFRSPLQIAEEAAIVDLVSGGRLELGLGPGYRSDEFDAFGADAPSRYRVTNDCIRALRAIWAADRVRPPTVQRPLPLWLGYGSPQGARRAGLLGVGLLAAGRHLLEPYLSGLLEGGWETAEARMATPSFWVLAEDPERTWSRVERCYEHQWRTYRAGGRPTQSGDFDTAFAALRSQGPEGSPPAIQAVTPADAATQLRAMFDGLPVEHIFFWASIAGMPDDVVEEHVRLVATDLAAALTPSTKPV